MLLPRPRWALPLLALLLLSTGCASWTPPPGQRTSLRYSPREAETPSLVLGPGRGAGTDGARPRDAVEPARRGALAAHLAFTRALGDVSSSTRRISVELSRLEASKRGIAGPYPELFVPFVEYGLQQLRWIDAELAAATQLSTMASEMEDPDMQLALLRLGGPRLQAAMMGSMLLAVWLDFLHLSDVLLAQHPSYSVERLFQQMNGWRTVLGPTMTALASREPGQAEAAAADLPALIGHLTGEFAATRERVLRSGENLQKMLLVKELLESLALGSAMKMALPRLLGPATSATLSVGLVMGSNGVMMGTRIVVSAEWVEMMRQLVRAGVISLPAVSAAVRIHSGHVMMAEAYGDLPKGVREALGDGPEVRAMRVTGRAGAGMAEPPEHHVLPQEFREWFEKRGFTGEMSIDQFCVRMEQARHEAIHGGGDWRLGRTWAGEWNRLIMSELRDAEMAAGRMLTRNEILNIVAEFMKDYGIPMNFIRWRGR
ncbi:DUF2380 domain-containing protein [Archangium lansingense]|uniref:DUF2380 domain-containing protein n=1 Tax=Archangium lansingense TaxID=2995310 RepID=A0ABT4A1C0_9BACT|nr:DUF2380 domain-containing protein [Archangium lansinium]MCY1075413.1 DUF2380 domain-containing protein [Archangium lansinium]